MGETKEEVVVDERPIFKVTQAGGFATGLKKYEPGEMVVWEIPLGWNTAKHGKHFAAHGPSVTFEPMNPPAVKLMEDHKKLIEEKRKPKPTPDEVRASKLEELVQTLVKAQSDSAARQDALMERFASVLEKVGGKK